jgi:large subunit ribosomal protein L24e
MESHICSFCGASIEPGTGKMFVKKDGTILFYCSTKCQKNHNLKRIPRRMPWTIAGRKAMGKE